MWENCLCFCESEKTRTSIGGNGKEENKFMTAAFFGGVRPHLLQQEKNGRILFASSSDSYLSQQTSSSSDVAWEKNCWKLDLRWAFGRGKIEGPLTTRCPTDHLTVREKKTLEREKVPNAFPSPSFFRVAECSFPDSRSPSKRRSRGRKTRNIKTFGVPATDLAKEKGGASADARSPPPPKKRSKVGAPLGRPFWGGRGSCPKFLASLTPLSRISFSLSISLPFYSDRANFLPPRPNSNRKGGGKGGRSRQRVNGLSVVRNGAREEIRQILFLEFLFVVPQKFCSPKKECFFISVFGIGENFFSDPLSPSSSQKEVAREKEEEENGRRGKRREKRMEQRAFALFCIRM